MKNEKMKWYFLIAAALVVGAMVGYFATNSLSTTGNAKTSLNQKVMTPTSYENYAFDEINKYIKDNDLETKSVLVYRKSTQGLLKPSTEIKSYDLKKYTYIFTKNTLVLVDKETGETNTVYATECDTSTTTTTAPDGSSATVNWHYGILGIWSIVYN